MAESAALKAFRATVGEQVFKEMAERAETSRLASGKPRTMALDAPAVVEQAAREIEAILNRHGHA